jgi:hypothetical protein
MDLVKQRLLESGNFRQICGMLKSGSFMQREIKIRSGTHASSPNVQVAELDMEYEDIITTQLFSDGQKGLGRRDLQQPA